MVSVAAAWMRIPHMVQVLLMIMGLDLISGILAAIATKSVNSSLMLKGLFKKLSVLPLLALLHIIEAPLNLPFEFESVAVVAFILYEAMSIVENAARAGVPIPAVIVSTLAKAKIKTATEEDIRKEFESSEVKVIVNKSSEILKTSEGLPDLKVDTTVTSKVEKHVEPVETPKP